MAVDPDDPGTLDLFENAASKPPAVADEVAVDGRTADVGALRAELDRLHRENQGLLERALHAEAAAEAMRQRLARRDAPFGGPEGVTPACPAPRRLADLGNMLFVLRGR